ncbi:hypothetical protein [Streptomyces sp. YU58]|uniref:hypothetical protein n=1 Tax=Streptomyces sp. SX92 TaxID=3158972 RepID=UPI0027B95A80|nr:hypothetical protein [Streptomyces coralus]WLW55869.1 hypothetical protein QU709_33010 [Streptomyces coralus]
MAQRGEQHGQPGSVSNVTESSGTGNTVLGAAARGNVNQRVTVVGGTPEGQARLKDAHARLDELRAALRDHTDDVNNIAECEAAVQVIGQQLDSGQPQQTFLGVILGGLFAAIGSVSDVVSVAEALQNAINALFT